MITLIVPNEIYLPSYLEAYDTYMALGGSSYGMTDARAVDIFEKYHNYRYEIGLRPDRVGSDYYWLVDTDNAYFIGEIAIRHRLNEALSLRGGHIGYVIRSDAWNRGYGTRILSLALEKAKDRGLKKVLCTCNEDNIGSARVMEKNGFVLQDKVLVDGMLCRRYWKELETSL